MSALTPFADLGRRAVRYHQIQGQGMEPELRAGDLVAFVPVDRYSGSATYLIDTGGGIDIVMAEARPGSLGAPPVIYVCYENPRFTPSTWALEKFEDAVLGRVFAHIQVKDHRVMRALGKSGN